MKINRKIFLAVGLIGITSACSDLDVDVNSYYTSYPTSEIAIAAKMADIYYSFAGPLNRRYDEAQSLSSDEYVGLSFDNSYVDNHTYSNMSLHLFSPDDASTGYYDEVASGISKANQIIVDLGGDDAEPSVIAPARAMRAFFHFILMDSYGNIPILDHLADADEKIERKPRADVAKFIEKELLASIPYLSSNNTQATYGKPNKWMAEALLVKLYINWPVYTATSVDQYDASSYNNEKLSSCVAYCDSIIKSGKFNLSEGASGYHSKFFADNGYKVKDFIYAMPYDTKTLLGMTYARFRSWKKANTGISYYGWAMAKSCAGVFALTPQMANLFTLDGDARNNVILGNTIKVYENGVKTNNDWIYNGAPQVLKKEITLKTQDRDLNVGEDVNGYNQGYKSVKFLPIADDYNNHERSQSNDVPIFRYADIVLTKAEAIVRGASETNGETALSLFNQIRSYAGAPTLTATPTLQDILAERGREFLDEHWRRNDMIRFGTFESDFGFHRKSFVDANGNMIANFDKTRRIFPIPTGVLNNNTNWQQNPGY
ncbi:MAG: RagB/SusD family nutrient uptake outer membrane protein [Prevotella sp.]|nr:RagB/SusD family nutrient uptake outer membrane protein [Prevotella sp.]